MSLFCSGDFTLHSGRQSSFLVDCGALTDEDLAAIAAFVAPQLPPFQSVEGIPKGGLRFAESLNEYATGNPAHEYLLVDDVLTSGGSMLEVGWERRQAGRNVIGLVLFARGHCPAWVRAVWQMGGWLK